MQVSEIEDFEEILERAELNADTDREIDFIDSLRGRLEAYGEKIYISEKQLEWLERIAYR